MKRAFAATESSFAPSSTQRRRRLTCSGGSGGPPFGIFGSGPETYWTSRLFPGSPGYGNGWSHPIVVSPEGSKLYVVSASRSGDYLTLAYTSATGTLLWKSTYDGTGQGFDQANAVGVSPNGRKVFVTGQSYDGVGFDYATLAYRAG